MMENWINIVTFTAAIGCGLMAGVFFDFSTFVMQALGKLPPGQAISAMQSINTTIVRSLFMVVFLGMAACSIALLVYSTRQWGEGQTIYLGIGSVLYLVGVMFVTIFFNVPLNDSLAGLDIVTTWNESAWTEFASPWIAWNHVRTVAAVASSIAFTTGLAGFRVV